jgi:hypothetical protein
MPNLEDSLADMCWGMMCPFPTRPEPLACVRPLGGAVCVRFALFPFSSCNSIVFFCLRVCTLSSLTRPLAPTRPQLQSNAAIFKVESAYGFQQWYYERLQPWVHYVPVAADLSDLRER